jgi:hypothetical protein
VLAGHDPRVAERAEVLGIRSVPGMAVDGKLSGCCAGRGVNEDGPRNRWPGEITLNAEHEWNEDFSVSGHINLASCRAAMRTGSHRGEKGGE